MTTLFKFPSGGNYYAGQIVDKTLRLYVNDGGGACVIIESGKYVGASSAAQTESLLNGLYYAAIGSGYEIESTETMLCPVALNETLSNWSDYVTIDT